MGCDIHLHVEVKIDGSWHHLHAPNLDRWYALFAKMAGVRGDASDAIAPPRGLPADITALTRWDAERWSGDGHSHSHLTAPELVLLEDWYRENARPRHGMSIIGFEYDYMHAYLFGNSFAGFHKYPGDRPQGLEDVRFVFWFDN